MPEFGMRLFASNIYNLETSVLLLSLLSYLRIPRGVSYVLTGSFCVLLWVTEKAFLSGAYAVTIRCLVSMQSLNAT